MIDKHPSGTLVDRLGRNEYSDAEQVVLNHFFTNTDRNIYCPTDNLPFPVWAFLVGQYSRNAVPMRDRFLEVFDQMGALAKKGKWATSKVVDLDTMADAIASGNQNLLEFFYKTANEFLGLYGVDHGHASLRDADKMRFAIEGVSQVSTNFLQMPDPCLGDYQEKSTRYIPFTRDDVVIPPRLLASSFAEEIRANNDALMEAYERLTPVVYQWIEENAIDKNDFMRESKKTPGKMILKKQAYNNTLNAKVFDIMRYFLPLGLTTSLGATWPTRVVETHVSQMLSHPLEEYNLIGQALKEEGLKVSPGLLKHTAPNEYFGKTTPAMFALAEEILGPTVEPRHIGDTSLDRARLLYYTPDMEERLLAGMLYESASHHSFDAIVAKVKTLSGSQKDNIFEEYCGRRGPHDSLLGKGLRLGTFTFELLMDHGAWRDIKRQRVGTQLKQEIRADMGYAFPLHVQDAEGLSLVKEEYMRLMDRTAELFDKVHAEFPRDSVYLPAMGHLGKSVYEFDPRQGQYFVELRTTPQGHHSYVTLVKEVYRKIEEVCPRLAKYIRAGADFEEASRQRAELRAQEKREANLEKTAREAQSE